MEQKVESLETLRDIAHELVSSLKPTDTATLITLSGELGAGKTTFSQMVGEMLGVSEHMVSPTFVLEKIYDLPSTTEFSKLIHIDAYRLKSGDELTALGFSELLQDPTNIILLEWPERVMGALPLATVAITLQVHEDGTRTYNEAYA
jgi:tRNA threonylcarbamoyl adenosine modification protein YjeE